MSKPVFNNTENEHFRMSYRTPRGNVGLDYWISRAVAVDGYVFAFGLDGGPKVLVVKRSKTMMDEPLKYCVPCGYLDWDETSYDAMVREVYEETSFYIPDFNDFMIFNNDGEPFWVNSNPANNRQNVALNYITVFDFTGHKDFFPEDVIKYKTRECESIEWLSLTDFLQRDTSQWAFNHDRYIKKALKFFNNKKLKL